MTIHEITLHYIALHCITLHYTTLQYIAYMQNITYIHTLHTCSNALHTLHSFQYITFHYTTLLTLHYSTLHYIILQYITLHYITYMTWHDMTRHDMTYLYVNAYICIRDFTYVYKWRIELPTRKGHGQSGCSPIGCEGSHTDLNIPSPLPASLVLH